MKSVVFLAIVGPFAVSLLASAIVRLVAVRVGFIDKPGGHKQHERPVALGGGIAIFWAMAVSILGGVALAWLIPVDSPPDWLPAALQPHLSGLREKIPMALGVVLGAFVLHVVGLVDDRKPLGPGVKFVAQFAVAFGVVLVLDIRILTFAGPAVSVPVTVLWIVLITNAFNFLDNMDGLSAGVASLAAIIFALASFSAGQLFVPVLALVVAGSAAGFLVFNFHPARMFMGDAGSLVIGYMLAVLTASTTFYDPRLDLTPVGVFVPVIALAVPLYDVTTVVFHRLRLGLNPLRGDRRHFSHRLVRRGLSVRGAVLTIYLATAATGFPAVVLPRVSWGSAVMLLLQCFCVVLMIAILEHTGGNYTGDGDERT